MVYIELMKYGIELVKYGIELMKYGICTQTVQLKQLRMYIFSHLKFA